MIITNNKREGRKPSRLIETVDIMDLIPSVGSDWYQLARTGDKASGILDGTVDHGELAVQVLEDTDVGKGMIGDLWVEAVISVKGVSWVGDDGVSGVSLLCGYHPMIKNGGNRRSGLFIIWGWCYSRCYDSTDEFILHWFSITLALTPKPDHYPQTGLRTEHVVPEAWTYLGVF
ncbi:hypothetical protein Tco_1082292 [Tanacetum coccineum]|uniref:Uncharacterized protein n=1 Tax=Tanacetum coccineum TaxID=301880 RepID=A0ABQ5I1P1_9ASTR